MHLKGGRIVITTNDVRFPPNIEYGKNEDFVKVFILAYVKFLCDSPLFSTHGDKPSGIYVSFLKELANTPLFDTVRRYSQLSHRILSNEYTTGADSTTRVFIPEMIKTPIFKEYHLWYETGRPDLLKYISSFLLFGKKLEYEDETLNATSFRGWLEVEDKLRTLKFLETDLANLRLIVSEILAPLNDDLLLPKHGSGKVAERGVMDILDKISNLRVGPKLAYAFQRESFGLTGRRVPRAVKRWRHKKKARIVARLKFVRRDLFKSRSICMEPIQFMYYQQEVQRWLRASMDDGLISRFCNIEDQTPSQLAAVHGSIYLSTDTIDLSAASDSVHVDLVDGIFPAKFRYYLKATRTSQVEVPGGQIVHVKKFAPMGSACCFPVQCIVFTAVCILSAIAVSRGVVTEELRLTPGETTTFIKERFHRTRTEDTPFTWRFEPPVVYGDDIAVDSRSTGEVISTLQRLGFTVNENKSFVGSQSVRESCGVFAFGGHDITPVLFRLPFFKKGKVDASVVSSLIGNINWVNDNGYHALSSFLLSILKGLRLKYRIPFQTDGLAFGIFTKNKHLVRGTSRIRGVQVPNLRWNADWQRYEELVLGIGQRDTKTVEEHALLNNCSIEEVSYAIDSYNLDQWWRSRIRGNAPLEFSRGLRVRAQETRLVPTWAWYEQGN